MWFAKVMVASVVVALSLAATTSASEARGGTSGNGAELVPVVCHTEYGFEGGGWDGQIRTADTPEFVPPPDFGPNFAGGTGTAIFTPNGNFEATCHGIIDLTRFPTFNGGGSCFALRGGDPFGHGAKAYSGTGEMVVNANGRVTITCHGSFTGILP